MAHEECSATSVVAPTPTNWWPDHAASAASLSSWSWQNPNSSNCDHDVSISTSIFTAPSNGHSADVDSSRRLVPADFITVDEHAPGSTHTWSSTHLLSSVGSNGSTDSTQDGRGIYEVPPFDYLKKMDNNWEFPLNPLININTNNFNEKNISGFNDFLNIQTQRLIGAPDPNSSFTGLLGPGNRSPGFLSCLYGHDDSTTLKVEDDERPFNGGNNGVYDQINMEADRKYNNYYGGGGVTAQSPCTNSVANSYKNNSRLIDDIHESKPCFMPSSGTDTYYKKQTLQRPNSHSKESKERKQGNSSTDEGKKKRSDQDSSQTGVKKTKNEVSAVSSAKMQAPKVKLADKITALQQIVSPFGKTDTASVLLEAIGYIKFLQEQVQLLSNPYMKTNPHKDPWGSCLERKEKEEIIKEVKFDLRSRGLCLVPISCTPQVYRENSSGSDYWTPTYRGCNLYR